MLKVGGSYDYSDWYQSKNMSDLCRLVVRLSGKLSNIMAIISSAVFQDISLRLRAAHCYLRKLMVLALRLC